MALFKSALLTEASGSIGGMVLSHNRGGLYIRARTVPTNPNTPAQVIARAALALLVVRWNDTLTQSQRNRWNLYAANVPLTGPLGDPITVSGINMYVRSNVTRIVLATPIIDEGPSVFDLGTLSAVTITNASEAVQQVDVNFTEADPWNVANGHLIVQQSRPQNPSIDFFRGPYRFMGSVNGIDTTPSVKPVVFAFVAGQRLFFKVRATLSDGRLTAAQFLGPVLTVA